MPLPSVKDQLG